MNDIQSKIKNQQNNTTTKNNSIKVLDESDALLYNYGMELYPFSPQFIPTTNWDDKVVQMQQKTYSTI